MNAEQFWAQSDDALRTFIMADASVNDFLLQLYANYTGAGYTEVRLVQKDTHEVRQLFRPLPIGRIDEEKMKHLLKLNAQGYNCLLRIGISQEASSRQAHITHLPALWADVDAKRFGHSMDAAFNALLNLPVIPSAVVNSGGGWHAYWLLDEPFALVDDIARKAARRVLRGIARAVGGDEQVTSLSNTLRLPGTLNCKYPDGRRAHLQGHISEERLSFREMFFHFAKFAPPQLEARPMPEMKPREDTPPWIADYIRTGSPEGKRNHALYVAARAAVDAGWSFTRAVGELGARGRADGLREVEVLNTIKSAYKEGPTPQAPRHLRVMGGYEG